MQLCRETQRLSVSCGHCYLHIYGMRMQLKHKCALKIQIHLDTKERQCFAHDGEKHLVQFKYHTSQTNLFALRRGGGATEGNTLQCCDLIMLGLSKLLPKCGLQRKSIISNTRGLVDMPCTQLPLHLHLSTECIWGCCVYMFHTEECFQQRMISFRF